MIYMLMNHMSNFQREMTSIRLVDSYQNIIFQIDNLIPYKIQTKIYNDKY